MRPRFLAGAGLCCAGRGVSRVRRHLARSIGCDSTAEGRDGPAIVMESRHAEATAPGAPDDRRLDGGSLKPYTLPPLAYDYGALEPHYSARILELHHGKHHKAYVDGVDATLDKLSAARADDNLSAIVGLEKTLAFNLSGHVLHTTFWTNLSPDGGDRPDGELAAAI